MTKINCKHNDSGAWCNCTEVKRSLFGLGARCCMEYPPDYIRCQYKVINTKKPISPPPSIKCN